MCDLTEQPWTFHCHQQRSVYLCHSLQSGLAVTKGQSKVNQQVSTSIAYWRDTGFLGNPHIVG